MLRIVNDVLQRGQYSGFKRILAPYLHPNGIKQMAAKRSLRIAHAVIHLLGSLERGKAQDRIDALRTLKEEVLTASESSLPLNTARVLLQIMKELVRSKDDPLRQLVLAHDFRRVVLGKPRSVRRELKKYHLIEMPEDWSQLAFDDHVHDANTKGRKSPTHLIMDAWIKGIRKLTVIYYTVIDPAAAAELLEAAKIMRISARIGIELRVRLRDRFIKLLWTPRDLANQVDFLNFLHKPDMAAFQQKGRDVLEYQHNYIWSILEKYNSSLRKTMSESLGVGLPAISRKEYLEFVGVGQPTLFHLGSMISALASNSLLAQPETRAGSAQDLDVELVIEKWLAPEQNPEIHNPYLPHDTQDAPELLSLSPVRMVQLIRGLHVKSWITLDLNGLSVDEVLVLLHQSNGGITHLEIFNLRYFETSSPADYAPVLELQAVVNAANVVKLKKYIHRIIDTVEMCQKPFRELRLEELEALLEDLSSFHALYKNYPLRSRIGSDSTGQSSRRHGMGLVVSDTLPRRSQRALKHCRTRRFLPLPITLETRARLVFFLQPPSGPAKLFGSLARTLPGCFTRGNKAQVTWKRISYTLAPHGTGNLYTLGGIHKPSANVKAVSRPRKKKIKRWANLNSNLKNLLKILFGFIPAAISFYYTKDWWLLAYLGPVIWFGITGVRNIIQSALACGGLQRSSLYKWNDYVSWERFSDSLLYTGFSVPLLDYLVKTVLLDHGLGITTATAPVLLFTIMALVNGAYISTHNIFRGLPRRAVVGNFFRSVLSIPLAVLFNLVLVGILGIYGVPNAELALQKWAAIISKFASDCVAGVIEGMADRSNYIRLRIRDLDAKLEQLFRTYARLEVLYPQDDALDLLASPKAFIDTAATEQSDLEKIVIVNALDLMYFWMYQPQARTVLRCKLRKMERDERKAFLASQWVLEREKEISLLLIDGLLGRKFNNALAFYLNNHENYLEQIQSLASKP